MFNKLASLLGNIVGRIKQKMVEHLLTWGGIYLPAGLFSVVFAFDKKGMMFWGFIAAGILLTIAGGVSMVQAYDKAVKRDKASDERFALLITEIQGLRQNLGEINSGVKDIRGKKDDKPNSGKPT